MAESAYDVIVIGSGPGGYVAAIRAAQLGMSVAVIERDVVGGRCLNYACIPAKAVLRVADIMGEVAEASEFGIEIEGSKVDFAKVGERRQKVVKTLTGGVSGLFKKNKVEYLEGHGSVTGDGHVKLDGGSGSSELEARKAIILATGSVPRPLPQIDFGGRVIGTEEAWALTELPARLAVFGAGASGAELASAYGRLGSEVLLFEALDRILPNEDADISKAAARALGKQRITIHAGTRASNVVSGDSSVTFDHSDGSSEEVDYVVIAAGRGPDVEGLGLEAAGVKLDEQGLIAVDAAQRTSVAKIYAIGDLVRGPRWPTRPPTRGSSRSRTPPGSRPMGSTTRTSRGRRSAPPTSRRSA
jgi:dihydrolipoamide dehydrogenase